MYNLIFLNKMAALMNALKGRNHVDLAVTNDFETAQIHTTTRNKLSDSLHIKNFSIITCFQSFWVRFP